MIPAIELIAAEAVNGAPDEGANVLIADPGVLWSELSGAECAGLVGSEGLLKPVEEIPVFLVLIIRRSVVIFMTE